MSSCSAEITFLDLEYIKNRVGIIDTRIRCPRCVSDTYRNKARQQWCSVCDWSNDKQLSNSLKRLTEER